MTVKEDVQIYHQFWNDFLKKNGHYIETVAIHSARQDDGSIFNEIFKHKKKYYVDINNWNLDNRIPVKFDLIVINNVFFYSKNPTLWLNNLLNSCKFLILQDIIDRKRGGKEGDMTIQLNDTTDRGDSMRYSFSHLNQKSLSKIQYDVSEKFKNKIIDVEFYKTESLLSKHFIASFKGDWSLINDKIVRIDDFPTGIRPILDDLEPIYNVLMEFEKRKIRFVLGIVPTLLTDEMIERLKTFKYLILAQHGYNHKYNELSKKLIDNNDPYNDWCCMDQFNEFEGMTTESIKRQLEEGKKILERIGPMNIYIPPCNRLDVNTLSVLEDMDIKVILGDNIRLQSTKIQIVPSQVYGRVKDLNNNNIKASVFTFHATWEYDDLSRKNYNKQIWDQQLDLLMKEIHSIGGGAGAGAGAGGAGAGGAGSAGAAGAGAGGAGANDIPTKLERIGTNYGGWVVPENLGLNEKSVVYSGGVGEDVSFDLLLHEKYKCNILLIDPTEKSKKHFEEIKKYYKFNKWKFTGDIQKDYYGLLYPLKPNFDKIQYLDIGLWDKKTTLEFYKQTNENYCSQTFIRDMFGEEYDEVPVDTIKNIMDSNGHTHIDLLKLDIEGSEIKVLSKMLDDNIYPSYICVEFDLLIKGKDTNGKTQKLANRLVSLGYKILANDNLNITFKYMK